MAEERTAYLREIAPVFEALGWTKVTVTDRGLFATSDDDEFQTLHYSEGWGWSLNTECVMRGAVLRIAPKSFARPGDHHTGVSFVWIELNDAEGFALMDPAAPSTELYAQGFGYEEAWVHAAVALHRAGLLHKEGTDAL